METIQRSSEQEGKIVNHGRGVSEYAHVVIRVEPLPIGSGTRFENLAGNALLHRFLPAVRAGLSESQLKGPLLGAEVTDISVALTGGSYHETDSTDSAFSKAARNAFERAISLSEPVLLEPVMRVHVLVSDDFVGELSNEIIRRRGEVKGMDTASGNSVVEAWLPLSEAASLTRMPSGISFGKAKISMEFLRYEKAPSPEPPDAIAVGDYT
jgi:elongation factor G